MADVNTVIIVSNRQDFIEPVSQKLVLLRNLDKVKSCSFEEVTNTIESLNPNVMILHCEKNDSAAVKLVKKIRQQEKYRNLPILFVNENCSRETIIEAFDSGISDIIFMPIIDYELLIRTIWCLQKNETALINESRTEFLTKLGIVQENTGVYSEKYCEDFLKNEIAQSKKYSQKACILLISPDKKYPDCKNSQEFIEILKKSIRLNDSIVVKDEDKFYIYLQKTKLNGAYSVFERINSTLGVNSGANAGVVEVQEQKYEDIIEALDAALKKASENTNSLIVASDFYSSKANSESIIEKIEEQQQEEKQALSEPKKENPACAKVRNAFDKNSVKLFNQAYNRKLKAVILPAFKKYESMLKMKNDELAVSTYIGAKSIFNISSGTISASMLIEYNGIEEITVKLTITENEQKRLFETDVINFTILDYKKLSLMLSELIDKFAIIFRKRG